MCVHVCMCVPACTSVCECNCVNVFYEQVCVCACVSVSQCAVPPPDHTLRGSSPIQLLTRKGTKSAQTIPSVYTAPPGPDQVLSGSAKHLAPEGRPGCPHFTEGETETQRTLGTWSRLHSKLGTGKPGTSAFQTQVLGLVHSYGQ